MINFIKYPSLINQTFLFILLLNLPYSVNARTFSEIKKDGTLLIATEGAFPPFNFMKNEEAQGFEIELVNEMAKRIGLKTKWQAKSFEGLLIGLDQNRYDLVAASHAVTPERKKAVDFLSPHYCSGGMIVTLKAGPKTLKELKGKKVAVQVSSIYPKFLETHAEAKEVKTYPTDPDSIQALLTHKVDAALTDRFLVKQMSASHPELQMGEIANPEKNAMAVKKGNAELHQALQNALNSIFKDGTYKKLSQNYFHEDIRCKSTSND